MYFMPKLDTSLSSPYVAVSVDIDGEPHLLMISNPAKAAHLRPWLREHLMQSVAASAQTPPGPAGQQPRPDNVFYLEELAAWRDALFGGPVVPSQKIVTDQ